MKRGAFVPIEKYLHTAYHADREYADGKVLVRNWGDRDHSTVQGELIFFFGSLEKKWKVFVFPGLRIQMSASRIRVPDICVYTGEKPKEQIPRTPPFICIEILSSEDCLERTQQKIDDYLNFGVPYVFVINLRDRRTWAYTRDGSREIKNGVLFTENPSLALPLAEIFAELD